MAGYAQVYVDVHEGALRAMSGPSGIVFKWARQRRSRIERLAIATCPVDTGDLRDSINASYEHVENGVFMYVTAGQPYAKYVHGGTPRHDIGPSSAPRLVFEWKNQGRMFVGRVGQVVDHPGNAPNPWLRDALEEVMHDL